MLNQKLKAIPKFETEDAERVFWEKNDSTNYINWDNAQKVRFSKLHPSVQSISLRLPQALLERIKILANKQDVPYQSLMKMYLSERVETEITAKGTRTHTHR
jgi:predicted DNA binding CopG/RHH family protein